MKPRLSLVFTTLLFLIFLSSCKVENPKVPEVVEEFLNDTVQDSQLAVNLQLENESEPYEEPPPRRVELEEHHNVSNEPVNAQELLFVDTISHNSGLTNGIAESGQPVLITIVDNAAAELANVAQKVDTLSDGHISPNFSDSHNEYEKHIYLKPPEFNDSDLKQEIKSDHVVHEENETSLNETTQNVDEIIEVVTVDLSKVSNVSDEKLLNENATEAKQSDVEAKAQEEIPSFSEWAQKQLEEAEKNKEDTANESFKSQHKVHISNVNLKVRSKNYASPDCGAKIIAANPESGSSSFILSPSRDEYMLNTCNSRIWFIVELCEAIQAKKIDLANFELFSSTPKNFSVFVSDRFPTREWAGVGQFIAKDERDVQTFNLHPHLFGKFMKVELHSHYGSEHYCPISLFRVYGTSEFEVFETENSPQLQANQDNGDDDDDVIEGLSELEENGDVSRNLFGSARDAVLSIMKKAAEVLVKSSDSKNSSVHLETVRTITQNCRTPSHIIVCDNCSNSLFKEVYDLMSCRSDYLKQFVELPVIHKVLCNSDMCQNYGLDFKSKKTSAYKTEIASYISTILVPSYVAALCNMLAIIEKKVVLNISFEADLNITSNLTADKRVQAASNDGMVDDLLNKSFKSCIGDDCDKIKESHMITKIKEDAPDKSTSVNVQITIPEIKPTKTISSGETIEATVRTTDIVTDSSNLPPSNLNSHSVSINIESSEVNQFNEHEDVKTIEVIKQNNTSKEDVIESSSVQKENSDAVVSTPTINEAEPNFVIEDSNTSQEQLALDTFLNEYDQASDHAAQVSTQNVVTPQQGQKESVFLRLSNRIKTLEKNMSLSGQYLEELSRRYKKQVEEMQKTFEKTLVTLNQESKLSEERDQKNTEELLVLQHQIAQLSSSVNILLTERESWLGSLTFFKVIVFEVCLVLLVIYLCRRTSSSEHSPSNNRSITVSAIPDVSRQRRLSVEETKTSDMTVLNLKRRASEEDLLAVASLSSNIGVSKGDKKKKKKKAALVQRSASMVSTTGLSCENISSVIPKLEKIENEEWTPNIELPVALEESEFIIPEIEPIDFNNMGEIPHVKIELTPKREFPKTNGSIIMNNKKPIKVRRLSSPAFFKGGINKPQMFEDYSSSIDNGCSPIAVSATLSYRDFPLREIKSEERDVKNSLELSQTNDWSSVGELSQTSSTSTTNSATKPKRSKKNSFKNMLKKVF